MQSTFIDFTTNVERVEMDTEFTTIATAIFFIEPPAGMEDVTVDQVARVQFFSASREAGNPSETYEWIGAARCKDIYANEIASNQFYQTEFSNPSLICPDTRNITIYNNPFLFDTGRNFVMVINDCNTAVAVDLANNLSTYTDSTCTSEAVSADIIDDIRVSYKIMDQNFNPGLY